MRKVCTLLLLLVVFLFAGCNSYHPLTASEGDMVGAYILSELDPLVINFLGIPKEKEITTVIDENGQISIPYIDEPVQAAGMTISGLERKLEQIYLDQDIYKNLTINIQTSAKTYYMEGEIRSPQEYRITRRITLLQAIAAAGGYTDYADKKNVMITRGGEVIKVNAKKIEKNPELDILIEAGDRIKVERSWY